jgi:hypothetical protein
VIDGRITALSIALAAGFGFTGALAGEMPSGNAALLCETIRSIKADIAAEVSRRGSVNKLPYTEQLAKLDGLALVGFDENTCQPGVNLEASRSDGSTRTVFYTPAFRDAFPDDPLSVLTIQFSLGRDGVVSYPVLYGKNL